MKIIESSFLIFPEIQTIDTTCFAILYRIHLKQCESISNLIYKKREYHVLPSEYRIIIICIIVGYLYELLQFFNNVYVLSPLVSALVSHIYQPLSLFHILVIYACFETTVRYQGNILAYNKFKLVIQLEFHS